MALALAICLCIGIAIAVSRSDHHQLVVLIATTTACTIVVGVFGVAHEILIVGVPEGLSDGEFRVWCVHYFIGGGKIGLVSGLVAGTLALIFGQRRKNVDERAQNRTRP
jgi:hypothetical protein